MLMKPCCVGGQRSPWGTSVVQRSEGGSESLDVAQLRGGTGVGLVCRGAGEGQHVLVLGDAVCDDGAVGVVARRFDLAQGHSVLLPGSPGERIARRLVLCRMHMKRARPVPRGEGVACGAHEQPPPALALQHRGHHEVANARRMGLVTIDDTRYVPRLVTRLHVHHYLYW